MLLLDAAQLADRRAVARGALAPLHDSLAADLEPLLGRAPYVPEVKALLSRAGGRCELDGQRLDFDPWSPHEHRCPVCGTLHRGELHHRAWITSYQLWLAERAVHGGLLHLLRGNQRHASLARDILLAYVERYLRYPNVDNVLGPTRLFFSTYLESIWLLQICVAADLLAAAGDSATADVVRDRIVEPSSALIAEFDEGMSNRQVWNNAALLAAAALRGDERAFDERIEGPSGVRVHLSHALLADGTWYEGENYHQFALRGLWYAVTMAELRGRAIPPALQDRFRRAFDAPFLTALPDFTMPARKDSQYAVSLRQWRFAELAELGLAREPGPVLQGALARCYEEGHERRDTGRARSAADVEHNMPSSALTRADLGWRALLHALPELPPLQPASPRSALLADQGLAVFRRDDDVFVALEFGQSGGGHGHPDRLNILVARGGTRILDDLGTGSYVDPSLHWYRSTLAHNAPLVDGRSQPLRDGVLRAYDEREGLGWIVAQLELPDSGVELQRTVVVAPDYIVDELHWTAPRPVRVELPWHLDASAAGLTFTPAALDGGAGLEDGISFVRDAGMARVGAGAAIRLSGVDDGPHVRATLVASRDVTLFSACAPAQPSSVMRRFYLVRGEGTEGVFRSLLTWSRVVVKETLEMDRVLVELSDGQRHVHRRDARGWHVELVAGAAHSSIDLSGWREPGERRKRAVPATRAPVVLRRAKVPRGWLSQLSVSQRERLLMFELGEEHYRRSEDRWTAAGSPRATIALAADDRQLVLLANVEAGALRFAPAAQENLLDNEQADTMGAGVQLYVRTPEGSGGWMLVPEAPGEVVRVRPIVGWQAPIRPKARWRERGNGYEMRIEIALPEGIVGAEYPVDVDVIVNETTTDRQRRRGQLILSGGRGEFAYLRGDRHDPELLIPLVIVS